MDARLAELRLQDSKPESTTVLKKWDEYKTLLEKDPIPVSLFDELLTQWPKSRSVIGRVLNTVPTTRFKLWTSRAKDLPMESKKTWDFLECLTSNGLAPEVSEEWMSLLNDKVLGPTVGYVLSHGIDNLEISRFDDPGYATNFLRPWFKQHPDRFAVLDVPSMAPDTQMRVLASAQRSGIEISDIWEAVGPRGLAHVDPDVRTEFLRLVVGSPKTTARVSARTLDILIDTSRIWMAEALPRSRNDVCAMLRRLLERLRASTYRQPDFEAEKAFIQWLYTTATGVWLLPNSPYRCLAMAMQVVEVLVDSGVDARVRPEDIPNSQKWEFSIPIYSEYLLERLVNLVGNDYTDVRVLAAKLLASSPEPPSVSRLATRALRLLGGARGRQGDGGARVASVAYDLMPPTEASQFLERLRIEATQASQVHGFFAALALICSKHAVNEAVPKLLDAVYATWSANEDILTNGAPEGNLPMEFSGIGTGSNSQVILSHAWRAIKESARLIEVLVPCLTEEQLAYLSEVLVQQLVSIRHRGAFSNVYPAFCAVCRRCTEFTALKERPLHWVNRELESVRNQERIVTRRSAGLPMLVTGVVSAQPELLAPLATKLLEEARKPVIGQEEGLMLPQVHAFNCIRAIVSDSVLTKASTPFVEPALEAAVEACGNATWVVRNCGAMLVASIHARLFRKGPISARLFFGTKFPHLRDVLLSHLSQAGGAVETVFPVLSILLQLRLDDGYDGLQEFEGMIIKLLGQREWKIREQAARALATITKDPETLVGRLWSLITRNPSNQNLLHGIALALFELGYSVEFPAALVESACLETRVALAKVWDQAELPPASHPEQLNPCWAEYEAIRIRRCPTETLPSQYTDAEAEIWRLNIDRVTASQSAVILSKSQRPDIQALCVQKATQAPWEFTNTRYALSVRETALSMCGTLCEVTDMEKLEALIDEFGDEEAPTSSRRTALEALDSFTRRHTGAAVAISDRLWYRLLLLLSDDDDDIRLETADAAQRLLKLTPRHALGETGRVSVPAPALVEPSANPRALEPILAAKISSNFMAGRLKALVDFQAITKARESEAALFAVEKANMYRDENDFIQLVSQQAASQPDDKYGELREKIKEAIDGDLGDNARLWTQRIVVEVLSGSDPFHNTEEL